MQSWSASWNAVKSRVLPITRDEFSRMFRKARPPTGWPETIAVANSGGPDSTCLLFLVNRHITENPNNERDLPRRVVSLHVNHGLQSTSTSMALQCAQVAESLGVEHHTHEIPWGQYGIPPLPKHDQPTLEYAARIGRYRTLFEAVRKANANALAMGHHLNDQVETSLMRIRKGTTEEGAAGMRFVRRWGMGHGAHGVNENPGWSAYDGMKIWVVRPFLEVPKERLIATCEQHKLEYVTDKTNFMPHLTIRNAIRKWLDEKGQQDNEDPHRLRLETLESKLASFQSDTVSLDLTADFEQFQGAVIQLNNQAEDVDRQVDSILSQCTLRSPPGTYLTTTRGIAAIQDKKLQRAIVLRILRYVSFHPWGSLRAQIKRRSLGLNQISEKLWHPKPLFPKIPQFCAGGGVTWAPVIIRGASFVYPPMSQTYVNLGHGDLVGWLATRQRPPSPYPLLQPEFPDVLRINITDFLASQLPLNRKIEFLYDCRFLLTFDVDKLPQDILRIVTQPAEGEGLWLLPWTKWFWPQLIWRRTGRPDQVLHSHTTLRQPTSSVQEFDDQLHIASRQEMIWRRQRQEESVEAPWVKSEFIRPLSGL